MRRDTNRGPLRAMTKGSLSLKPTSFGPDVLTLVWRTQRSAMAPGWDFHGEEELPPLQSGRLASLEQWSSGAVEVSPIRSNSTGGLS